MLGYEMSMYVPISIIPTTCHRERPPWQNVFAKIDNSDPHAALSFDRLHTFCGGLFRQHLWAKRVKQYLAGDRVASADVEAMYVPFAVFLVL